MEADARPHRSVAHRSLRHRRRERPRGQRCRGHRGAVRRADRRRDRGVRRQRGAAAGRGSLHARRPVGAVHRRGRGRPQQCDRAVAAVAPAPARPARGGADVAVALRTRSLATRPLKIGPIEVDPPVVLAPMAGVTNAPFRLLCASYGDGLYVTEMVSSRALVEGNAKTRGMVARELQVALHSVQLSGVDPAVVGTAVRIVVEEFGADHVDLNMGCPVPKVTRLGGGAALPVHRRLLRDIVRAAVQAAGVVPVTLKMRKGVDDATLTYLDAGRIAEAEGVAAVSLHARTAEQLYSGAADWSAITELKLAVTGIPVLGNGDVWAAADAVRMMTETGCDGVVVGRGCLGRPWLFRDLADAFAGRPVAAPPPLRDVVV